MRKRSFVILLLSEILIGVGIFFLYMYHVRTVFEARTNFSHLSRLSRETLLRKEDALYYSFYKTLIEGKNFWDGYNKLINLTQIEYPTQVNVLQRFHVLPEVVISFFYHNFKYVSQRYEIPTMSCWSTDKHDSSLLTCEGLGDPFYFYLEFVWALGGFTVFVLYMYASFLSETIFGGLYAVALYIIFHKYSAKIYERPVARENFAFPFIFWQMFYLSLCIARTTKCSPISILERIIMVIKLTFLTTASLLCWQFSSIIFATQTLILIAPRSMGLISNWFSIDFTISQFLSSLISYYISYENKKYFLAWHNGPALALSFITVARIGKSGLRENFPKSYTRNITLGILLAFSTQGTITDLLEQSGYAKVEDNPFSVYKDLVLHWSLQRRANFATTLLACNPDFREVQLDDVWELIRTYFIKPYCLYGVVMLAKFLRKWRIREPKDNTNESKERARKYALEDFLEENRITMKEMSNKETEKDFAECLKLLEECKYDYDKYKLEKTKLKKNDDNERERFFNDVKRLKIQINENEKKKEKGLSENILPKLSENCKEIVQDDLNESNEPEVEEIKDDNSSQVRKSNRKSNFWNDYNFHYLYSTMQLVILSFIGISIKKLFFLCYTQGCVVAPTLCPKFWFKKHSNVFWSISLVVFFTSNFDPGLQNIREEYLPTNQIPEDLETMLDWINMNTEKNAVFGGPIDIITTVHLTTRRPIVNHPYLEMRQISSRTESIYSIYSRQQSSEIYNQCSQLKLQYLIVSFNDCMNSTENECDILNIWDEMQPMYRKQPQFCSELINKNIPSFLKVFSNKYYGIIKMFSQSVQLNLKYNKIPEKIM